MLSWFWILLFGLLKGNTVLLIQNYADLVKYNCVYFCHDDTVTSFIYYYWRADVETRVFVEGSGDFSRFSTIFTVHLRVKVWVESSFKMSKSFIVFSSITINTSKLGTGWNLTISLCHTQPSSQQNVNLSIFYNFPSKTSFNAISEKGDGFDSLSPVACHQYIKFVFTINFSQFFHNFLHRSDFGWSKSDAEPINLYKSKSERKEESLVSTILDYSP